MTTDTSITDLLREFMTADNVMLSFRDAARAGKVTTAQLRYWVKSGYLHTVAAENGTPKLPYDQLIDIRMIKHYLDEGFTLAVATKKAGEEKALANSLRQLFIDGIQGVSHQGETTVFDLGPLADDPTHHVYCLERAGKLSYTLNKPE